MQYGIMYSRLIKPPAKKIFFLYMGTRHRQEDGIDIIPAEKILKDLPQLLSGKQTSSQDFVAADIQ